MTYILQIETSSRTCSVCVSKNGLPISIAESTDTYDHARMLTALIQQCINEADITYSELSAIAVSEGPGSYTGLRIGTATAKGLCYALQIPLIGIPTLQSLAVSLKNAHQNFSAYAVIMPSRKQEVYFALYNQMLEIITAPTFLPVDQLHRNIPIEDCITGISSSFTREEIPVICSERQCAIINLTSSNMSALSYESYQFKTHKSLIYFEPLYLKGVYVAGRS